MPSRFLSVFTLFIFSACVSHSPFSEAAEDQPIVILNPDLPQFETSAGELKKNVEHALADADARLAEIVKTPEDKLTFENLFVALDDIESDLSKVNGRVSLIVATSSNDQLRTEAEDQEVVFQKWWTAVTYREDLYNAVQKYQKRVPDLKAARPESDAEDIHLYEDTLLDYRRAGMNLPKVERDRIQGLRDRLSELGVKFDRNIRDTKSEVEFTAEELNGVPDIESFKRGDKYVVDVSTSSDYVRVSENAQLEASRKKIEFAVHSRAVKENIPILEEMIKTRDQLAKALGYASWADYRLEVRMAENLPNLNAFLLTFQKNLRPKFDAELAEFKKLKAKESNQLDGNINFWDWRYYRSQYEKAKFSIDKESLRVFFEMNRVQRGVFEVYEEIFGIKITEMSPPYKWVEDLKLFRIEDRISKKILGYFYLDLFPRENKFKHFASFGVIEGKRLRNGKYQRPVNALVCNFPKPTADKPSLLTHDDVTTFFHEFGHALHSILTTAKYHRFSGTNVPQDFVEAPSQMLENWAFDVKVLNRFAEDYRDASKKIDPAIIKQLKAAKIATAGTHYSRQIALGLTDLNLHAAGEVKDSAKITADSTRSAFIPLPDGTNYSASWGHLNGYDASYYGYAWADAIGEDLLTVFAKSPEGLLDPEIGMRLRNEIYAVGWSRPIDESIEKFLGRKRSLDAFYESVGIKR